MKLFLSATEPSSDLHAHQLLSSLETLSSDVHAFGIGGKHLSSHSCFQLIAHAKELSVMGFIEVLAYIPRIIRILFRIVRFLKKNKPDLAILIDAPDFHFLLARWLFWKKIPIVYYIPPKVWAWRKKRIDFLKKYCQKIFCIFPFEEAFYRTHGVTVQYVGNPLCDALPLNESYPVLRKKAREKFQLKEEDVMVVLLPGSRRSEVQAHLPLLQEAAEKTIQYFNAQKKCVHLKIFLALPAEFEPHWGVLPKNTPITVLFGETTDALLAANAGLVKSGTASLEAALLFCPHTIFYKPHPWTGWIFQNLLRYRKPIGLANWILGGEKIVPELVCDQVNSDNLSRELVYWLTQSEARQTLHNAFIRVREAIKTPISPSDKVAQEIFTDWKRL